MAKKRRQKSEKKEELDIKIPEFDEHEFIALELRKSKMSFIAFIFAIFMVVITYLLYSVTHPDWRGPVVLGFLGVVGLRFMTRLMKIDVSDFEWKNWFGSGAIYFFSWLAIFVLVLNPPFSDFAEPEIELKEFSYFFFNEDTNETYWKSFDLNIEEPQAQGPLKINITMKITDNSQIDKDSVKLIIKPSITSNATKLTYTMKDLKDNLYQIIIEPEQGQKLLEDSYSFTVEAKDDHDHKTIIEQDFKVWYP